MKFKFIFLSILFLLQFFSAQAPNIDFQKNFGGSSDEFGESIIKTSDGGYVLAGSSNSKDIPMSANHGGRDYYIVKTNALGELLWQKLLGGSSDEYLYDVKETTDGGYILAGYTNSNDGDVGGNHGSADVWIVKLNQNGELIWQKTFGGSSVDFAQSISLTNDGGYIIAGYTYSNDGDVTNNLGSNDYWVIKIDSSGSKQWQKTYGGSGDDSATSVIQSSDGNYVIAGWSSSNNGDATNNHGNSDYWILKINPTGGIIWQKSFGGTSLDGANSIIESPTGGFVIAGFSTSSDGDLTENRGLSDIWIIKISDSGNLEWQKSYGGTNTENARSIKATVDGGYIIAGYTLSNNGDVTNNHGGSDCWIIKISNLGNIEWQKVFGGTKGDSAESILQNTDGSYVFFCYSNSTDGDITNNLGGYDYWVLKLKPDNLAVKDSSISLFYIYPNPVKDILYFSEPIKSIELYSSEGRLLIKKKSISNLNMKDLPLGNYILNILDSDNKVISKKVIKK